MRTCRSAKPARTERTSHSTNEEARSFLDDDVDELRKLASGI